MGIPRRSSLAWKFIDLVERRPVMQQPPERIHSARKRRALITRLPGSSVVVGRPHSGTDIRPGEITLPDGHVLPLRIYTPKAPSTGRIPVIVNFHGGGWVSGDARQSEWWCAGIAARARVVVVSVDYRLAPEFTFPTPVEDCYAATCWVAANAQSLGVDETRLTVMGDSAGGNLAAAVALMARDRGGPHIALQVLIYPAVDLGREFPSYAENADAPCLGRKDVQNTRRIYLADVEHDGVNPYASPLRADPEALPAAIIQTAQYDPLRDEGIAYAKRLRAGGVTVWHTNYEDAVHGYVATPGVVPMAKVALRDVVERLRAVLRT